MNSRDRRELPHQPHPHTIQITVTVQEEPFDIKVEGIEPDGRFNYSTQYVVLAYGRTINFSLESPMDSFTPTPWQLSIVEARHEDLHTQPYNGRIKVWDMIGVVQLVDIYKARVFEWQKQPRDRRLRS